ncbi:MAG: VWA domain-containing protein [Candidatus Sulfotelmatobacter sp.]
MAIQIRFRMCSWLVCIFALLVPSFLNPQTSAPPASTAPSEPAETQPVIRATARLVLLDVVVTDHNHAFVPGLKASDFTVLENGKPQSLSGYAIHMAPSEPKAALSLPQLPPHQYTNFPFTSQTPGGPVTIVLLDMLNTSGLNQQYARKQMIQFLKTLPPDRPVALFTLTSELRLVQGFSGDSTALMKAASEVLTNSPLLTSPEAQTQQEEISARTLEVMNGPSNLGPTGEPEPVGGFMQSSIPSIGHAIRDALNSQDSFQKAERMSLTIHALDVLARSVAGYSGRKNLLWLSAEFPVAFGPSLTPYSQVGNSLDRSTPYDTNNQAHELKYDTPPIEQTAALLTASQMAVYPIDVGGVSNPGTGIDISTSTSNLSNFDLSSEAQNATLRQTTTAWDAHEAMSDIARQTGGHAFYGTNDVKDAMTHAIDEGSSYYTLAYVPANHDWNGQYRKLEVKLAHPGAQLTYRRGYYSLREGQYNGDRAAAMLANAMKLSVPEYTMLLMKVQVLPPDAQRKTVSIDYAVDAHDIAFADGPDQRKLATLDFVATAWSKDLKLIAHQSDTMNATVRPEPFQRIMTSGIPFHQELDLKPGVYTLRIGVLDRSNQKMGTVDVPLTVPGPTLGSNTAQH